MGRPTNTLELVLATSVEVGAGCWVWTGPVSANGYGHLQVDRRALLAHRFFYEMFIGPIPKGQQIDHLCRNRKCVRPSHLEAVSPRVNTLRSAGPAAINSAKTRCCNGHAFVPNNVYITPDGRRQCLTCRRERERRYEQRRRQERA